MSLINDMLKDLDQRNDQASVTSCSAQRELDQKDKTIDTPLTRRFWSNCYKGLKYTILVAGISLGGTALNQPVQIPNQLSLETTLIPEFRQSAMGISSTQNADLFKIETASYSSPEPITLFSETRKPRSSAAEVNVTVLQDPRSVNSTAKLQSAQALNQFPFQTVISPKSQKPAMRVNTTPIADPDTEETESHNIAEPLVLLSQTSDPRPRAKKVDVAVSQYAPSAISTAQIQPAQAHKKTGLEKAIFPKLIPPAISVETSLDTNIDKNEKKSHSTTEKVPTLSQISEPHPRTAKGKATVAQVPPSANTLASANTLGTNNSAYIEVTHRPLSSEQQILMDFRVAANTYKDGNYSEAERLLEDLLAQDNAQHKARLLLARLYLQQDLDKRAELVLSNGLLHFPQHAPYVSLYAQMLAEQGRDSVAIDALQNGLPGARDNADFHALLAGLYQRNGDSAAAANSYLVALGLEPTHGEWWMGLGISSEQAGDRNTAESAYSEALQYPLASEVGQYAEQRLQQLAAKKATSKDKNNK